jgi:hypothetical protein
MNRLLRRSFFASQPATGINLVSPIPSSIRRLLARWFFHARNLFSVGIGLHLAKPQDQ